jgi:aerobic carbon-monoxide dehydrogenase medium subunit
MKPAPFDYAAPTDVDEALALLSRHGGDARALAGGQSLVPLLNFRLARPGLIVDLNRIESLAYYRAADDGLVVGALCRQRDVELDAGIAGRCAAIADALPRIGHVAIRNRGTVVGSLAHADPAAEWPALALLLDATLRVAGPDGEREVPAKDFFTGVFATALDPGELIIEATFPWGERRAGSAFVEVAKRHGDFALVAAGATLVVAPDGTIEEARIALAGVGETAVRAGSAEAALKDRKAGDAVFAEAAATAAEGLHPADDIHAPAAYRRRAAQALVKRALALALTRSDGGGRR